MIKVKYLSEVNKRDIIELMNHPKVIKHMPLAQGEFDDKAYYNFITAKQKLWDEFGCGPWAFFLDKKFVGWGGLQHENGDADIAIVLHPKYWGLGKDIYDIIKNYAIDHRFSSMTALLPISRTKLKIMDRLGFKPDGESIISDQKFNRFRIYLNHNNKF